MTEITCNELRDILRAEISTATAGIVHISSGYKDIDYRLYLDSELDGVKCRKVYEVGNYRGIISVNAQTLYGFDGDKYTRETERRYLDVTDRRFKQVQREIENYCSKAKHSPQRSEGVFITGSYYV